MAMIEGGDKLRAKLAELAARVSRAATLEVGFIKGATYPDGTSVAEVAAYNEFGVQAHGQPPRPFFRNMVAKEAPGWGDDLAKLLKAEDYDATRALATMGEVVEGQLRQSIVDLKSPVLAPSTIAAKGFDKPLIDDSIMINSVAHRVT